MRSEAGLALAFGLGWPERALNWARHRSRALRSLVALMVAASCVTTPAWAGPTGGTVTGGQAIIQTLNQETLIKQSTGKAIINWNSFSLFKNELAIFQVPNANSISLNRVLGNQPSSI